MLSQIIGSGFVTGENLVTNDQLAQVMDTSDAWIRERSGVETRYYVEQGTATSDLGVGAAKKALEDAGVAKDEVDYIVFATMTPDHYFPGCGAILQDKLGMAHIPALDIRQQCTGFIYGLQVSDALLKAGQARTVLLVGAKVHSGFMPWKTWDFLFGRGGEPPTEEEKALLTRFRDRAVLFGDAAGRWCSGPARASAASSGSNSTPTERTSRNCTCPGSGLRAGRSWTRSRSASGATVVYRDSPRQRANVALAEGSSRLAPTASSNSGLSVSTAPTRCGKTRGDNHLRR